MSQLTSFSVPWFATTSVLLWNFETCTIQFLLPSGCSLRVRSRSTKMCGPMFAQCVAQTIVSSLGNPPFENFKDMASNIFRFGRLATLYGQVGCKCTLRNHVDNKLGFRKYFTAFCVWWWGQRSLRPLPIVFVIPRANCREKNCRANKGRRFEVVTGDAAPATAKHEHVYLRVCEYATCDNPSTEY